MNTFKTTNPRRLVGMVLAFALIAAACGTGQASTSQASDDDVTTSVANVVTTTDDTPTTTTTLEEEGEEGEEDGDSDDEKETETDTTTTTASQEPAADFYDLVTINGAQLAYSCVGEGSPRVIIEHGLSTFSFMAEPSEHWYAWIESQLGIAEFTEVCVYGRRGVAGSDPVDEGTIRTVDDQIDDLVAFLDAMDFEEPVIVAGHSWGGAIVQLFADRYPERTAALVLIDSVNTDYLDGYTFPSSGPIEFVDIADGHDQLAAMDDLDDLPITVLSAGSPAITVLGTPDGVVPAGTPYHDPAAFEAWTNWQNDLTELSSNLVHLTFEDSGHLMQVDRPDAIIDAVAGIMERIDD